MNHGTDDSYTNYGCRCDECCNAHRVARKRRYYLFLQSGPRFQPADITVLRLRALTANGYSSVDLAKHSWLSAAYINQLRRRGDKKVMPRTAEEVTRLWRKLSSIPGPNQRAAGHARRLGYPTPADLDPDVEPSLDEVAIDRAMHGDKTVPLNRFEMAEAIHRLLDHDTSHREVARILGISERRVYRVVSGATHQPYGRSA